MNLEITDYMMEKIVSATLLDSIKVCYIEIYDLAYADELEDYQLRDLQDSIDFIRSLVHSYEYYNADTSPADKYQPDGELAARILEKFS